MLQILTIGHSNHSLEDLFALLARHDVTALADVRSQPHSGRYPHFCKAPLQAALKSNGLAYVFLGRELGARWEDPACLVKGRVDFERVATMPQFGAGLERLREGAVHHRIALMCAEREPLDCHRTLLVARQLCSSGFEVAHILADGTLEPHESTVERLLGLVGLEGEDLFRNREERIADAYRIRSARIAYEVGSTEEEGD